MNQQKRDATVVVLNSKGEEISEHVPVTLTLSKDEVPALQIDSDWIPGPFSDAKEVVLRDQKGQDLIKMPIRQSEVATGEALIPPRSVTMS